MLLNQETRLMPDPVVERIAAVSLSEERSFGCDLAGDKPLYVFVSKNKNEALISNSLVGLLTEIKKVERLQINPNGLSHLMQDGFVPAPETIYQNVYMVSIGDRLSLRRNSSGELDVAFDHSFPFVRSGEQDTHSLDVKELFGRVGNAVSSRVSSHSEMFLFHSAGKDSNLLALALSRSGMKERICSMTYKAPGDKDESSIVQSICRKLGLRHEIVELPIGFKAGDQDLIMSYLRDCPLPCADNAALMYAFLGERIPKNADVIDGMGSDIYIGHIPPRNEYFRQQNWKLLQGFSSIGQKILPMEFLKRLPQSRAHITGLSGFDYSRLRRFYSNAKDCSDNWLRHSKIYSTEDYLQYRARVRGVYVDTEKFIRKVRNAADVWSWNAVFPYLDEDVASYVFALEENLLFDRKALKNKLFIRELLKKELDLDSDRLGKKAFSFDTSALVSFFHPLFRDILSACDEWDTDAVMSNYVLLCKRIERNPQNAAFYNSLLYRLLIISLWLNVNRFTND